MSLDSVTEYALSFSEDAVHLQRRETAAEGKAPAAWRDLGSVEFVSTGFRDELTALRAMTGDAEPLPVTLVIPDDQILYTTLTVAPGADRELAVGRALDGLTPYAIDDLAFDWEGDGDSVRVAAVARQTLREARDFAAQYGFDGQGFRAAPGSGAYPGEPVFVLDPPARARPAVDPAQAGVTSAGLQFAEDSAPSDLDLGGDAEEQGESAAETTLDSAGASDPAEPEAVKDAERPEPAPVTGAAPTQSEPAKSPDAPDASGAATVAETAASVPEAEPEAAPVTEAAAATVVRHTPVAETGAAGAALNPRARAIHERAAGARKPREPVAAPPPARRPGERGGLVGLVAMLAALVAGLILIWAFVVPRDGGDSLAEAAPAAERRADPAPQATAVPPATEAAPQSVAPTTPAAAPAPGAGAQTAAIDRPAPAQPAPGLTAPTAPVSALTEEERRRVIVAAAAVAAAVVPPPTHAAAPAAPSPATPQAPAVAAAAPAASVAATRPAAAPQQPGRTTPAARSAGSTAVATAPAAVRLSSSARPQLAPRRSTPQTSTPRADSAPRLPANPLPYAASQKAAQPIRAARPPERARRARAPAATPAASPAATSAGQIAKDAALRGSSRPPLRPEGSAPDLIEGEPLTSADDRQLRDLIRDLGREGLVEARMVPAAQGARLAQARPQRKPGKAANASDAASASAVDAALRAATTPPPDKPGRSAQAATPARDSGGLLRGSSRPQPRPGTGGGATPSAGAIDAALSAAAAAPTATPGAVQLSALASSPLPPRRGDAPAAAADPAPGADPATAAPAPAAGPSEAEIAARRALDEQLQAQAEARIRARAQADAAAEAQARAQAEARARAQAAAEERAARARKQEYKPPEIDNEPEIAASALSKGVSSASVAKAATQSRGMDTGRTTIIGIIGAGQASRALIRLRSGKVVTVRLGDRIDGGTINSIGNGRLTYVKSGRTHELRMLDGR